MKGTLAHCPLYVCVRPFLESTKAWTSQEFVIRDIAMLKKFPIKSSRERLQATRSSRNKAVLSFPQQKPLLLFPSPLRQGWAGLPLTDPLLPWVNPFYKQTLDKHTKPAISLTVFPSDYDWGQRFYMGEYRRTGNANSFLMWNSLSPNDMRSCKLKRRLRVVVFLSVNWFIQLCFTTAKWTNHSCVLDESDVNKCK